MHGKSVGTNNNNKGLLTHCLHFTNTRYYWWSSIHQRTIHHFQTNLSDQPLQWSVGRQKYNHQHTELCKLRSINLIRYPPRISHLYSLFLGLIIGQQRHFPNLKKLSQKKRTNVNQMKHIYVKNFWLKMQGAARQRLNSRNNYHQLVLEDSPNSTPPLLW